MFKNSGKFLNWLVTSSSDPTKVSLTVKAFLTNAIPMILFVLHLLHVDSVAGTDVQNYIDAIGSLIVFALVVVANVAAAYGLLKKIFLPHPAFTAVIAGAPVEAAVAQFPVQQ